MNRFACGGKNLVGFRVIRIHIRFIDEFKPAYRIQVLDLIWYPIFLDVSSRV